MTQTAQPIYLRYTHTDLIDVLRQQTNDQMEAAINARDSNGIEKAVRRILNGPAFLQQKYVELGSFSSALRFSMRKGDYQEVDEAIQLLSQYPDLFITEISICWAACKLQIRQPDECLSILEPFDNLTLLNAIDRLINLSTQKEKEAYQELSRFRLDEDSIRD